MSYTLIVLPGITSFLYVVQDSEPFENVYNLGDICKYVTIRRWRQPKLGQMISSVDTDANKP